MPFDDRTWGGITWGPGIYTFPTNGDWESPRDFPFLRNDYDPDLEDRLCARCRQLNLEYLFKSAIQIKLGTVADVREQECKLCDVMLSHSTVIEHPPLLEDEDKITLTFNYKRKPDQIDIRFERFCGEFFETVRSFRFHSSGGGVLRQLRPRYNPEHVLQWLRACAEQCSKTCELRNATSNQPSKAEVYVKRFIHVQRECLVEASTLTNTSNTLDFAALSYVWGSQEQNTVLTKSNVHYLHDNGSLASSKNIISKTIRDAILVCRDLGVPLLWVDALCIQQDGETGEMEQINNMDRVYESATFTIVAMSGNNANAGLVGTSGEKERQIGDRVQQYELLLEGPSLADVIHTSHWSTRAWTYQEYVLARRRIVFSDGMIYFACEHGRYSEDQLKHHHKRECILRPPGMGAYFFPKTFDWATFTNLIQEYTSRNLSYPEDAISASAAIIKFMDQRSGTDIKFNWAMPSIYLDAALLWRRYLGCKCQNVSKGLLKRDSIKTPAGTKEKPPSWSWVCRQGHVKYSDWFVNELDPALSFVPSVNWPETGSSNSPGRYLYLEADTATFWVTGRTFEYSVPPTERGSSVFERRWNLSGKVGNPLYIRHDKSQPHCGVVYDDEEVDRLPRQFTFIKLSQSVLLGSSIEEWQKLGDFQPGPGRDRLGHVRGSSRSKGSKESYTWEELVMDSKRKPFDHETYDYMKIWSVYNVMMVAQEGETMTRLGIGKIHVDAFDNAESFKSGKLCLA